MRTRALTASAVITGAAVAIAGLVSPAYAATGHAATGHASTEHVNTGHASTAAPDGIWWIYEQFSNTTQGDERCAFTGRGLELSDLINTFTCSPDGSLINLWINTNTPVGVLGG